ncbi:Uncharacterised protein [Serratia quinivorans]|nr:Uncharacterised protein [Serratia quinivorans]
MKYTTIFTMRMIMLLAAVAAVSPAHAGRITISNPTSEKLSNGKTLCIYEDSIHSFQYVTKGKCPYAKTFDTDTDG